MARGGEAVGGVLWMGWGVNKNQNCVMEKIKIDRNQKIGNRKNYFLVASLFAERKLAKPKLLR